ncbi:hypothetical protein [Roseivirga sp.]|uniref:hypothetical protein n=1 Tax=Roseivirga sp. TaxID=1964215 RepID=UPI003B8CCFFA
MKISLTYPSKCFTILALMLYLFSCSSKKTQSVGASADSHTASSLELDHFNIWVNNPEAAKNKLISIGFKPVPDSLSAIHYGQGTAGKYFNFLNTYIEFIYVYNQEELEENNAKNIGLDFTERANFSENGASPFGLALKLEHYDPSKIPFEKVRYQQEWMGTEGSIYAAKSSKTRLSEPSVFVVYPNIQAKIFETKLDLNEALKEYEFYRQTYIHPNGAEKVTKTVISTPLVDLNTLTIKALNRIHEIEVKQGTEHLLELHFDNGRQGKTFDLRPELPLMIYL